MGLMRAQATYVVIESYGMKAPVEFLETLSPLAVTIQDFPQRVDVSINADCASIPLFTCSKEEVFPMFHSCGYGYSSIMTELDNLPDVRVVTYPPLLHSAKALSLKPLVICLKLMKP